MWGRFRLLSKLLNKNAMTTLLLAFAFISQSFTSHSDTTPISIKIYPVSINKNMPTAYRGYLQGISDTTVQLSEGPSKFGELRFDKSVSYNEIDQLVIHRRGDLGKGVLVGGSGGALIGGAIGAITYTPCNCFIDLGRGFDIVVGASLGSLLGILVGIAVSSGKKRFAINRNKISFDKMRSTIFRVYGQKTRNE